MAEASKLSAFSSFGFGFGFGFGHYSGRDVGGVRLVSGWRSGSGAFAVTSCYGSCVDPDSASPVDFRTRKRFGLLKVHATDATVAGTEPPKWWEKNAGPNMIDIHSTQEFLGALSQAGDKLVIVEFYGTWCASCRALFQKLCKTAQEHPEILFLKVNFDENKPLCKSLNVKVLPYFHLYRGADGQVESFSCSLAKFQKIKDAIERHSLGRSSVGPPKGIGYLSLEKGSL